MTQSNRGVWAALAAGVGYLLVLFRVWRGETLQAWRLGEVREGGFGGGALVCLCTRLAVGWCVVGFGLEVLGCSGDGVMHNVDPHCSFIRRFAQVMLVRRPDYRLVTCV